MNFVKRVKNLLARLKKFMPQGQIEAVIEHFHPKKVIVEDLIHFFR
jgi:hypothetical protein|tara:strand:+ start:72636 stop:72773 length:138 start_codon:yes stop_codon:yes gene_type:complete